MAFFSSPKCFQTLHYNPNNIEWKMENKPATIPSIYLNCVDFIRYVFPHWAQAWQAPGGLWPTRFPATSLVSISRQKVLTELLLSAKALENEKKVNLASHICLLRCNCNQKYVQHKPYGRDSSTKITLSQATFTHFEIYHIPLFSCKPVRMSRLNAPNLGLFATLQEKVDCRLYTKT